MKEELIKTLEKLPEEILIKEKDLILLSRSLQEKKESVRNYEIAIENSVLADSEKEEFKKEKALSNADKRKIETRIRLDSSGDYKILKEKMESVEDLVLNEKLNLEFLKRSFLAKKTILNVIGGEE